VSAVKHVVLVGLPGVGKSTMGRGIAGRLKRGFIDLDIHIERSFGKTVSRIFAEDGEAAFRNAESEMSASVALMAPSVIAPGGGWVQNSAAMAHLLDCSRIIYLRVTPEAAIRRMGRGIDRRPMFKDVEDPYETMRALYEVRGPIYENCSEMTIETVGAGRASVIARVVELVTAAEQDAASRFTNKLANGND
jgi:shikimate kinase